jgi:cytochrome P450
MTFPGASRLDYAPQIHYNNLMPDSARLAAANHIDLSSSAFWRRSAHERNEAFSVLRREQPISWQRPPEPGLLPPERFWQTGYWAVVCHPDVVTVSRNPTTFLSSPGVFFQGTLVDMTQSILEMDPPRHTQIRRLVSSAFTPRQVARIENSIRERAHQIIAALDKEAEFDFIAQVATPMPTSTISDMLGVPESDRGMVSSIVAALVKWNDHDGPNDDPLKILADSVKSLMNIAVDLAQYRIRNPTSDLMTAMAQAEIDGARLTPKEIGEFFVLLCTAGLETTRRTTGDAAIALTRYPQQREFLLEDLSGRIGNAVEEFIRWASPVWAFCRTAAHDTKVGGYSISAGERLALFYRSANFDEAVFESPDQFNVARSPNPHVAFGGGGPHHCLGASLARAQLRSLISEFLTRAPRFEVGEPEALVNSFAMPHDHRHRRVRRLPCRLSGS